MHPDQGLHCLGMGPDWVSNPQPVCYGTVLQPTEPHWLALRLGNFKGSFRFLLFFFFFLKILFIFRERRREGDRETNISVWLPLTHPQMGTWPATQACALTGNQTGNPLVCRPVLNPLSYTSQGFRFLLKVTKCWVQCLRYLLVNAVHINWFYFRSTLGVRRWCSHFINSWNLERDTVVSDWKSWA